MFEHKVDQGISLKLIEKKDAKRIFELTESNRSYLRKWLPWVDETRKVEDTEVFIQSCLEGFANNKSITTAVQFKGEIVGVAGYNELDWSNKVAYIGYWLAEEYQGNGIMTKVAEALTDYAIRELEINRVDIRAAFENMKSRAVPERLGFKYEGCIRQSEWLYDHYVDHAVYGMLANEWKVKG
ncbi:GNAT family N-acetyltransferase [Aquibacillus albus]|uniref:Ribosomal-protein-serine acetyltransferase n=1 Tax=Aquibacillus albus TaxID=1168171 RepID=A0ABS2MZ99_9BACI|nr:GNAT family protein [Aquibacillus albus]MBM7571154.1 ribosomal-protein-serine acetyltransferase [Aquibacillus albus]